MEVHYWWFEYIERVSTVTLVVFQEWEYEGCVFFFNILCYLNILIFLFICLFKKDMQLLFICFGSFIYTSIIFTLEKNGRGRKRFMCHRLLCNKTDMYLIKQTPTKMTWRKIYWAIKLIRFWSDFVTMKLIRFSQNRI